MIIYKIRVFFVFLYLLREIFAWGMFLTLINVSRARFLLGGRHGDFKFFPPPGYAPCYEALLPRERMRIEPIKEYKHDFSGVRNLLGPTQSLTHTSFTPCPVDTAQVLSPTLSISPSQWQVLIVLHISQNCVSVKKEVINLKKMLFCICVWVDCVAPTLGAHPRKTGWKHSWAVGCHSHRTGLDLWSSKWISFLPSHTTHTSIHLYRICWVKHIISSLCQFRDDNKKLHPCLVDFQSLPEPERNYNLQMSGETLKWIIFLHSNNLSLCCYCYFKKKNLFGYNLICFYSIPQDTSGSGLPCGHGRWESRRKSEEDQAAQNVCCKEESGIIFRYVTTQ